jgi:hypothetical protein
MPIRLPRGVIDPAPDWLTMSIGRLSGPVTTLLRFLREPGSFLPSVATFLGRGVVEMVMMEESNQGIELAGKSGDLSGETSTGIVVNAGDVPHRHVDHRFKKRPIRGNAADQH